MSKVSYIQVVEASISETELKNIDSTEQAGLFVLYYGRWILQTGTWGSVRYLNQSADFIYPEV